MALLQIVAAAYPRTGATAELLYPVAVSAVIVATLSTNWVTSVLSTKSLVILGQLSYGVYLIHLLVRNAVELVLRRAGEAFQSGFVVYLSMLGVSVIAAWIMNRVLEEPARAFGRTLAKRGSEQRRARPAGVQQS